MSVSRFPRYVYDEGAEPDVRFTLANERTFLAWIRTGLALIAAGVALEALGLPLNPGLRLTASVALLLLGITVSALAYVEWARTERALRHSAPLPSSPVLVVLAAGATLTGVLVLLAIAFR